MSDKGNIIIIAIACAVILVGGIFTFFELKNIPDVKWTKNYAYEKDDPYAASLFEKLIRRKFGSENVSLRKEGFEFSSHHDTSTLYIFLGNKSYFKNSYKDSLIHFADKGNNVLLISNTSRFFKPFEENEESDHQFEYHEEVKESVEDSYIQEDVQSIDSDKHHVVSKYHSDSLITLKFNTPDSTTYNYKNYYRSFEDAKIDTFYYVPLEDSLILKPYLTNEYDKIWFGNYNQYPNIDLHFVPDLFSNAAARQEHYLPHLNFVLDRYKTTKVILDNPSMQKDFISEKSRSPLTYIINTPQLKWAYLITLVTFLIYITNGGKRKQKTIPIKEQPKNTSLDYIKMISRLYEEQEQNEKLVLHMKKNFNHFVRKKYFIPMENINALSKKSGISKDSIQRILSKFESAEKSDFTDEQLYVLEQQINSFKINCK